MFAYALWLLTEIVIIVLMLVWWLAYLRVLKRKQVVMQEDLRQVISNLQQQNTELLEDVDALRQELVALKGGEYICKSCGLRKYSDAATSADF